MERFSFDVGPGQIPMKAKIPDFFRATPTFSLNSYISTHYNNVIFKVIEGWPLRSDQMLNEVLKIRIIGQSFRFSVHGWTLTAKFLNLVNFS